MGTRGEGPIWKVPRVMGRTIGGVEDRLTSHTPVTPEGVGGYFNILLFGGSCYWGVSFTHEIWTKVGRRLTELDDHFDIACFPLRRLSKIRVGKTVHVAV